MEQRALNLLQCKMPLIIVRMSALPLLITLITAVNATTTPGSGLTCQQEIHAELVRELWSKTKLLINKLPRDESISQRLLPKFCIKCSELPSQQGIGWLEIKELIDVYQRSVFRRAEVRKLFLPHYDDILYRLQQALQDCVSSSGPSKYSKTIEKMERKIKKSKGKGALKAVEEFDFIVRWIDELAGEHIQ